MLWTGAFCVCEGFLLLPHHKMFPTPTHSHSRHKVLA
jgi:hypothetical protein